MTKKLMLVFIPSPGVGHLVPAVEIAKLMVQRDDQLSITILVMQPPFNTGMNSFTDSLPASSSSDGNIQFINLPSPGQTLPGGNFLTFFVESHKPIVKDAVSQLLTTHHQDHEPEGSPPPSLACFVVGMFCATMIDVANDFGVPSYIFFASSAASLGVMLHMQSLQDDQNVDTTEFTDSDAEFVIPSFANPVPARVLPSVVFNKDWHPFYYGNARRYKEAEGIIINTFEELEPKAISGKNPLLPPVYPIGPILNLKGKQGLDSSGETDKKNEEIMEWLDDQPPLSVVFLCFGSMGSFNQEQVKEIACALESSGHRFLWSLRQSKPKALPTEYANLQEVLPQAFLDGTVNMGKGKIIGWAPQVDILAHPAIGGFVSHCGWNSILESLWFGVPIAAWPLFSEQQLNAFEMIVELGLATEIKMDYRKEIGVDGTHILVSAECIERGIRNVMEPDNEIRKKVKEISEMSRKALLDGGSSYSSLARFITDMKHIISP